MDLPPLTAPAAGPATRFDLDHLAIAAADAEPVLDVLTTGLGAAVLFSERGDGFRYAMTRVGTPEDGMNLEVLEPCGGGDKFLERFLAEQGAGPHHLTFQTTDLRRRLGDIAAAGLEPVRARLDWAPWQEAFVLPAEGHGTVLQLAGSNVRYPSFEALEASAAGDREPIVPRLREGADRGWAERRPGSERRARMRRVVLGTPDLDGARHLFVGLLDGREVGRARGEVTVAWRGGQIRLVEREAAGIVGVELAESRAPAVTVAGLRLATEPG